MKKNQIVKFANPENEAEAAERFIVLEDRGVRVLVGNLIDFEDWQIKPTFVYEVADLEVVGSLERVQ